VTEYSNAEKDLNIRAVVLAGGKGTRLQPFTASFPKPLVPLDDTPIIEVLLLRLIRCGITDITITLGHLAELVKAYFDHRRSLVEQMNLQFVEEEEPTGTAGSLSLVPGLDSTFLVMNGDLLTNLDFRELVRFHHEKKAALTIATHRRSVKVDLGLLEFDSNLRITNFIEKPENVYQVSMGIYVYEPSVLKHIEHGQYLDFPELVLRLIARGERVCAFPSDALWLDIGRPDDYARAQELYSRQRGDFELV
jgi:NDP-mannose synthase